MRGEIFRALPKNFFQYSYPKANTWTVTCPTCSDTAVEVKVTGQDESRYREWVICLIRYVDKLVAGASTLLYMYHNGQGQFLWVMILKSCLVCELDVLLLYVQGKDQKLTHADENYVHKTSCFSLTGLILL